MKVLDDAYKNMKVDGDEKFASDYFSSSDPTFSKVKSFRTDINDTNGFQDFLDKNSTNANDDILRSICSQFYH
jgi:hypothetical protein